MKRETNKDKTTMTTSQVGVLIEDLRSQFRIFGEKLQMIEDKFDGKFDSLFNQVGKLTEDVFVIKADVRIIKTDIAEIKESLKTHDKRIAHLEETVTK